MTSLAQGEARTNDAELAKKAQLGDRRSYALLMERHGPRISNLAWRTMGNRSDAEDAVQDAMAAAWFKLDHYDIARPFAPWLTQILLNKCRDHLRRRKFARLVDFGPDNRMEELPSDVPDAHDHAESTELLKAMRIELSRIPDKLREALLLVVFDGQSQAEAARTLGVTKKTIETRVYRARIRLRERMKKFEG